MGETNYTPAGYKPVGILSSHCDRLVIGEYKTTQIVVAQSGFSFSHY